MQIRESLIFEAYITEDYGCTGQYQYQVSCMENRPKFSIHKNSNIMNRRQSQHNLILNQGSMILLL